jgi:hypothetical protein
VLTIATGTVRSRRVLLAAVVLVLSSYAIVVAGRVRFYATIPDIMDASRYHYVASMAIAAVAAVILCEIGRRVPVRAPWPAAVLCLWLAGIVAARLRNGDPPDQTQLARDETADVIRSINEAIAAAEPGEDVYIGTHSFKSMGPFFKAHTLFPGWAGVFVIFFPENVVADHRVYFVEPLYSAVRLAEAGRRTAGLLVPLMKAPPRMTNRPGSGSVGEADPSTR